MGLIIALVVVGILVFILSKQKQKSEVVSDSKYNSSVGSTLTIVVICLALIQAPFFYYYTFGLFFIIIGIPYLLISLTLTGILVSPLIKRKKVSAFHKYGVIVAIVIGITSLILSSGIVEKLDWKLRLKERELIVEKALNGEIDDYKLKMNCFPPISNGGNEIFIDNKPEGTITVTFYIDRGFIDHYSAFIYTTDTIRMKRFDGRVKAYETNKKIDDNWYRIAE